MIAPALLLVQAVAPAPAPPADWSMLPELPLAPPPRTFDPSVFVRGEVAARRCRAVPDGAALRVAQPVALWVDARGEVARIVPQAIGCPTVEQYTAGYVSTLARRSGPTGLRPGWYRYVVTYRWAG